MTNDTPMYRTGEVIREGDLVLLSGGYDGLHAFGCIEAVFGEHSSESAKYSCRFIVRLDSGAFEGWNDGDEHIDLIRRAPWRLERGGYGVLFRFIRRLTPISILRLARKRLSFAWVCVSREIAFRSLALNYSNDVLEARVGDSVVVDDGTTGVLESVLLPGSQQAVNEDIPGGGMCIRTKDGDVLRIRPFKARTKE